MAHWQYRITQDHRNDPSKPSCAIVYLSHAEPGKPLRLQFKRWLELESPPRRETQRDLDKLVAAGIPQAMALQLLGAKATPVSDEIRREQHKAGIRSAIAAFDAQQRDWLSVSDAAELLQLDVGRVSHLVKDGRLIGNGLDGRDRRIQPQSVVAYCKRRKKSPDGCAVKNRKSQLVKFLDQRGLFDMVLEVIDENRETN